MPVFAAADGTELAITSWVKASRCSFCPLPRVAATVARLFPEAELAVQPGAGHFPWLDDPFRFSGTVETFLRG